MKRGSPETEEIFAEDGIEKLDIGGVVGDGVGVGVCVGGVAIVGVKTGGETLADVGVGVEVGVVVEDTEVGDLVEVVVAEGVGVGTLAGVGVGVSVGTATVVFVGVDEAGTIVVAGTTFPSKEAVVRGPIIP